MKIKMSVSNIKKPVFNKMEVIEFINEIASDMQERTIDEAPIETGNLKEHGIKKEQIPASIYGEKVYLDVKAVRENHPSERQRKRPDGGNYPYYQEEGWYQHGRFHPGKFYFEKSFDITEWEAEDKLKSIADKVIVVK